MTQSTPRELEELLQRAGELVAGYFADRREDPQLGTIEIADQRYILVRAGAMAFEFFELVRRMFPERAESEAFELAHSMLYDLAHAMALSDVAILTERLGVQSPSERMALGPFHFAHMGWASVRLIDGANAPFDPREGGEYDHPASFEADSWIASGRRADRPVCVMGAGYSSGWCEASFGTPLVAVEILCRARGDEHCRFVMAPPNRIHARISAYTQAHPEHADRVKGYVVPEFFSVPEEHSHLRAEHARLRQLNERIIEALPGGLVHVRNDGAILRANREACQILGLAYDRLTGMYTRDFDTETIWEDGSHCSLEEYPVTRALATGQTQPPRTIGVRRPDGGLSWAVFTAVPVLGPEGTPVSAVVTFFDITERKAREEERQLFERNLWQTQKLESLGVLAGGIAHDFNNLLTGVLANVGLARDVLADGGDARSLLDAVELAAGRAAELTQQLLAYAGRGHTRKSPVDLSGVVGEMADLLRAAVPKGVRFELELARDIPPVEADATQLRQIVMNLITNAGEAIGSEGGTVTMTTRVRHLDSEALRELHAPEGIRSGRFVVLTVADTGIGMTPEVVARIFDPFFTTKFSGRGLGLAAVLGIVRGHGGLVSVESTPGQGSTIRVFLPASARVPVRGEADARPPPVDLSGKTCLVIDDDPGVLSVVTAALERFGAGVIAVTDGQQGLEALEAGGSFDLIVLDWTMPGLSGSEVLERIRAGHPELPVLITSGYQGCMTEGLPAATAATGFLPKPFRLAELSDRLCQLLNSG